MSKNENFDPMLAINLTQRYLLRLEGYNNARF